MRIRGMVERQILEHDERRRFFFSKYILWYNLKVSVSVVLLLYYYKMQTLYASSKFCGRSSVYYIHHQVSSFLKFTYLLDFKFYMHTHAMYGWSVCGTKETCRVYLNSTQYSRNWCTVYACGKFKQSHKIIFKASKVKDVCVKIIIKIKLIRWKLGNVPSSNKIVLWAKLDTIQLSSRCKDIYITGCVYLT